MRILLDHNVPAPMRYWLTEHQVETTYELGWAELRNGELLRMAEGAGFDLLITSDKSIRYQQNVADCKLAFAVLSTNDWTEIRKWKSVVVDRISQMAPGTFTEIEIPAPRT